MAELTWVVASPSGSQLAVGAGDGKVRVWRPNEGVLAWTADVGDFATRGRWTFDGRRLLVATHDGRVVVFAGDSGTREAELQTGHGLVRGLVVSPDGGRFATCGDDGKAIIWSAVTLERLVETKTVSVRGSDAPAGARAVAFVRNDHLVVGYGTGWFEAWDPTGQTSVAGGEVLATIDSAAATADGTLFLLGGGRGGMLAIGIDDNNEYVTKTVWRGYPPRPIAANWIDIAPSGAVVVAASDDSAGLFDSPYDTYEHRLGEAFYTRRPKPEWTRAFITSGATFVPGTSLIVTSHFAGELRVWRRRYGFSAGAVRFGDDGTITVVDGETPVPDPVAWWAKESAPETGS